MTRKKTEAELEERRALDFRWKYPCDIYPFCKTGEQMRDLINQYDIDNGIVIVDGTAMLKRNLPLAVQAPRPKAREAQPDLFGGSYY